MSLSVASVERRIPPLGALAVAIVAVSTSAILIELSTAPSLVKAFYRALFTTLLVAPVAVSRYRGDFARMGTRDALVAIAAGVALALHFASWFESLKLTSVAASVTLVQAQPLFVAVGAWTLLDERLTPKMVLGILVALVGAVAMSVVGSGGNGDVTLLGNLLALVGAVMAAGYVLAGRSLRRRVALLPYVTVVYSVCTVVLLGLVLVRGRPLVGYSSREWLLFLGMAVGPGLFGHTVINWALAHLESSLVSVSLLGEPVGSTLLAIVVLGQFPTPATVVAGVVVLGGITLTARGRQS